MRPRDGTHGTTGASSRSVHDVSGALNVALACAAVFQAVHRQNSEAPGGIESVAPVGMGARTGRVPARVCAHLMRSGHTLFQDHSFDDYDELRATITDRLDDRENAPVEKPIRIAPPQRRAARR